MKTKMTIKFEGEPINMESYLILVPPMTTLVIEKFIFGLKVEVVGPQSFQRSTDNSLKTNDD